MNKQAKIKKVIEEFKNGTLKTPDGKIVTSRKQALAIAMSESEDYAEKADLIGQICIDSVEEAEDIIKSIGKEELFEKSVYADTYENRKLGRVGQQYGGKHTATTQLSMTIDALDDFMEATDKLSSLKQKLASEKDEDKKKELNTKISEQKKKVSQFAKLADNTADNLSNAELKELKQKNPNHVKALKLIWQYNETEKSIQDELGIQKAYNFLFGDDIEKAQPGDEREYQGRMYVYGTTKSGKMGWKVKEKVKRGQGTPTSSVGGSSTTQKKTTAESRKIYNTILGINNTGTTVRETSDAFEVKFDPNDFKTHGKVSQVVSQIVRYYRQTNSVDIDEKNNKIVIRKKQIKSSNSVVHDINGTKVIVTQNRNGSYTLEANGKKVRSDDPSFFIHGTNIKPRVKTALAKEVGLDTAVTKKKLRPIGTGTNGPERRRK